MGKEKLNLRRLEGGGILTEQRGKEEVALYKGKGLRRIEQQRSCHRENNEVTKLQATGVRGA